MESNESRVVVWFSCGAASALAAKLAVQEYGERCVVVYCDTGGEHEGNGKFLKDIERWIGRDITIIRNTKGYEDHFAVFERTKYLVGVRGARCTVELKKVPRFEYQRADDVHVFGYTSEESARAERFNQQNPELFTDWILIRKGIPKRDCIGALWKSGIEVPPMYTLGYEHNNCIGCVKGGMGYWNRIRKDFPDRFKRMCGIERGIGHSIFRNKDGSRLWLDELSPSAGNFKAEPPISCGLGCGLMVDEITASD